MLLRGERFTSNGGSLRFTGNAGKGVLGWVGGGWLLPGCMCPTAFVACRWASHCQPLRKEAVAGNQVYLQCGRLGKGVPGGVGL